ncbi:MAG: hypothetical protein KDE47_01160 [Caldilineaceae bacterium]|nr:hypothetical protein [Caldilineaceae bacterium]MCB0095847.1 hypothetical protein [Caldilineaceae bacterium]
MIQIYRELTVETGDESEEAITLWLVSYQQLSHAAGRRTHTFIEALARWCLAQGWLLETGDDPYREQSLRIFGGAFSLPEAELEWAGDA